MIKIAKYPFFGLYAAILFMFWVLASEHFAAFWGGNAGAFLWTTFHFIINPIFGLILSIIIVSAALKQDRIYWKILSIIVIAIPLSVGFFGITGNIWFVKFLGINLK